jgi:23S rRNA pseudouridine1911/1915/1917 synthase
MKPRIRPEGEAPEHTLIVPDALDGVRLDKALRDLLPGFSRAYLRDLVVDGFVKIGGKIERKASYPCQAGERIVVLLAPRLATDEPPPPEFTVLYSDETIIVINKPPGLAAHRNEGVWRGSVADYAQRDFGLLPSMQAANRPGIVHRLDKDTSGVMVLARTEAAADHLKQQFRGRSIEKEYRAIVFGKLRFDSEWIEQPIGRNPKRPTKMSVLEGGRESSTYVEVAERFEDFTYVICRPKTGRTHQIRVHLSWLGHPIVGDTVYRIRKNAYSLPPDAPPVTRQLLHAHALEFDHPATETRMRFEAPIPDDFERLLQYLRTASPPGR